MAQRTPRFDLLCLGRLGVDLYGEQDGTPLAAVQTFMKYVGGSAANVCVGVARLGLSTAMCSRVGDEALGQFVLDTLAHEGVDTTLVQRDPLHPTGVVALALYKRESFPRIFFYTESADISFQPEMVDWEIVDRTDAVLVTGSYLINPSLQTFTTAVAAAVRERGARVVLDVDYRPVLWGLVPVGSGNDMNTYSARVTQAYRQILPYCDLVVGTEEEISVAGGSNDIHEALKRIREMTDAAIVLKRGAKGAGVFDGPIPENLDEGIGAPAYTVEVLNNTGAGDAFLSGFLSRWLRNHPYRECVQSGNASGAIVVTRNGCTPAMPFADEQERFIAQGGIRRPGDDAVMERMHRVGSRRPTVPWRLLASLREDDLPIPSARAGISQEHIDHLRRLLWLALIQSTDDHRAVGILVDDRVDREILEEAVSQEVFVARAIGADRTPAHHLDIALSGIGLRGWHVDAVAVADLLIRSDPASEPARDAVAGPWEPLARLGQICRSMEREMLVDLRLDGGTHIAADHLARQITAAYDAGIRPEYWIVPALSDSAQWSTIAELVLERDSSCRGYFVRTNRVATATDDAMFARSSEERAHRGVIPSDLYDPAVIKAWIGDTMSDDAFVKRVSADLDKFISSATSIGSDRR